MEWFIYVPLVYCLVGILILIIWRLGGSYINSADVALALFLWPLVIMEWIGDGIAGAINKLPKVR